MMYFQVECDNRFLTRTMDIATFLSFFICRILIFPYMFWRYSIYADISHWWYVPFHIPYVCTFGCTGLLVLQVYWMWYIVKIAIRTLQGKDACYSSKKNIIISDKKCN